MISNKSVYSDVPGSILYATMLIAALFVRAPRGNIQMAMTGYVSKLAWLTVGECRAVRTGRPQPLMSLTARGRGMGGDRLRGSVYIKFKTKVRQWCLCGEKQKGDFWGC